MSAERSRPRFGGPPVRVALVGLGWAGRSIWLPRLLTHPGYRVTALVDPDPGAVEACDPAGGVALLAGIDELMPDLADLVVVAAPNHMHAPVASRALHRGLSVFVEKPVCLTSVEAHRLAAAERDGGGALLAGSAARHREDVRALVELVATLGELRHIDVAWVRARGVPDAGGWFTSRQLSGGGALIDLGWHLLDTVLPMLGPVTVEQVVGSVSDDFVHSTRQRAVWRAGTAGPPDRPTEPRAGDVEDTARAFLVTDTGASVSLHASWASHARYDSTVITVEGTAGSATLCCTFGFSPNRSAGPVLTCTRDGQTGTVPVAAEPIGAEYDRQLDDVLAQLGDPARRGEAVAEAARTIDIIERVYRSARRGRRLRRPVLLAS